MNSTIKHAKEFAGKIKAPALVFLEGELGAGKTEWVRGFVREWFKSPKKIIPSPSYSLMNLYQEKNKTLVHMDLYRVQSLDDLESIGFWDLMKDKNIICIEWGYELLKENIKRDFYVIKIEILSESERKLTCHFYAADGSHNRLKLKD